MARSPTPPLVIRYIFEPKICNLRHNINLSILITWWLVIFICFHNKLNGTIAHVNLQHTHTSSRVLLNSKQFTSTEVSNERQKERAINSWNRKKYNNELIYKFYCDRISYILHFWISRQKRMNFLKKMNDFLFHFSRAHILMQIFTLRTNKKGENMRRAIFPSVFLLIRKKTQKIRAVKTKFFTYHLRSHLAIVPFASCSYFTTRSLRYTSTYMNINACRESHQMC